MFIACNKDIHIRYETIYLLLQYNTVQLMEAIIFQYRHVARYS